MALNVQDVLTDALSLVDFAQFGEAPEAEAEKLAIRTLNGMLGEWSSKQWINPKYVSLTCTPANNDHVYIGSDLTTGVTPDIAVDFMLITGVTAEMGSVVYTLSPISLLEYEQLSVKQNIAPPALYAWDAQFPMSQMWLYPSIMAAMVLRVTGVPRIGATGAQSTIDLDSSYYEAVVYNLACRLYPHLKRDTGIDNSIVIIAKTALQGLKQRNIKMKAQKARTGIGQGGYMGSGYWTSPLNTVNR